MERTYLGPQLYNQTSYYFKAYVEKNKNIHTLFSYGKPIISMLSDVGNGDKLVSHIDDKSLLTQTTLKHIRDFLFQYSHYNTMTEDNAKSFKKDDIMSLMFYDYSKLKELKNA